jgi:hypothetical protein
VTRYYVDISTELIDQILADDFRVPPGFRLISRWGPKKAGIERWIVEDDEASADYEDCLVEPVFSAGADGVVHIDSWYIV